jgi:hypothetical protein
VGAPGGVGAVGALIRVADGAAIKITGDTAVGIAGRISGVGGIVTIAVGCPDRPLRV